MKYIFSHYNIGGFIFLIDILLSILRFLERINLAVFFPLVFQPDLSTLPLLIIMINETLHLIRFIQVYVAPPSATLAQNPTNISCNIESC